MSRVGPIPGNKSLPKRQLEHQLSYAKHQDAQALPRRGSLDMSNVVNFLRPNKNEIDEINETTGVTALIQACENNSICDVQSLLSEGASVNAPDDNGRSPLMVSSAEGNEEIVMILLEHRFVEIKSKNKFKKNHVDENSDSESDSEEGNNGSTSPSPSLKNKLSPQKSTSNSKKLSNKKSIKKDNSQIDKNLNNQFKEEQKDDCAEGDDNSTDDTVLTPRNKPALLSQGGVANLLKDKPDIDIEAKDKYGWTALMYAALCGHENIANILIDKKANIHAVNIKMRTALHVAITYGKLNVAKLLLQKGADINALDIDEMTPAMTAAKHGEINAVNFCIENGGFWSVNKITLLTVAAIYGHLDIVINLLEKKVKPSLGLRDVENELVFIYAAEHKHIAIVKFMLEYGVDVNAMNELNENALIVACSKGHEEIINFLLQKHANIFHEDDRGYTAFMYAAENNLIQVVKLLISKGIKVNSASSKSGIQALMCASRAGHIKLANLLLEFYGASIDAMDRTKKTAFHYSCIGGHLAIADYLIVKGARYRKDIFNRTPLYYARKNGHFEVAAALEHKYGDKKILMRADLQPVTNAFDILFLTVTAAASYVDIVFDIINAYTFYNHQQFKYFALALFFQVIPILAAVTLQRGWGTRLMAILHLSVIREFYHSIRGKVETPMMCTLRIIETCLEACPSALLQLYVLILAWLSHETEGHSAKGLYGFLPTSQEQLLFLSILISIGSTSITFIKFVSSEKDRLLMPLKSIVNCFVDASPNKLSMVEAVYCYHCCEEFFRLLTLAVLFIALGGWALLVLGVSYIIRMILSTVFHNAENFAECTRKRHFVKIFLRIALSQITDSLWYNNFKLTLHLQILTTLEGLACSLVLLYIRDTESFSFSRIKTLLIIGGMAWVLKTGLYLITYFWMCTDPVTVHLVDDGDFGMYYNSSKQRAQMGKVTPSELEPTVDGGEYGSDDKVEEEYEANAVMDRKNYFRSIMKSVKKATANQFRYNYVAFPPIPRSEINLLSGIKEEMASKQLGLKRGLTNVRHNEDFHLMYPQFFQAVTNLAPKSIESMIETSLLDSKNKGRVARSPLRLLFNFFLELQSQELLCSVSAAASGGHGSSVFPDRVDWVEFLEFVKKVKVDELTCTDDSMKGNDNQV